MYLSAAEKCKILGLVCLVVTVLSQTNLCLNIFRYQYIDLSIAVYMANLKFKVGKRNFASIFMFKIH